MRGGDEVKNLIPFPTIEHSAFGERFFVYVDPASVIGITPILTTSYGNCHETGATMLLSTGATVTTSYRPGQVAAVLEAAAAEVQP